MAGNAKSRLEANLCESCYEVFFSKKLFEAHVQKCTEPRPKSPPKHNQMGVSTLSKCANCRRIFLGGQNLAKHVEKEHTTKKVLKTIVSCQECKMLFTNIEALTKHKEKEHPTAASSSAAVLLTFSDKPEADKKLQSKVVTIPQPKLISQPKVVTVSQPELVPHVEELPKQKEVSTPKPVSKPKPESDPKPESGSNAKPSGEKPETKPKSAVEVVPMPVPDTARDDLVADKESETVEAEPESMDAPTTSSPLARDEVSSPPMELMDNSAASESKNPLSAEHSVKKEPSATEEPKTPADKMNTKLGDVSASQQTTVTESASESVSVTPSVSAVTITPASVTSTPAVSAVTVTPTSAVTVTPTSAAPSVSTSGPSVAVGRGVLFACGSCNLVFLDQDMVAKHVAEKHGKDVTVKQNQPSPLTTERVATMYACGVCNAKFQSLKQVRIHISLVHHPPREASPQKPAKKVVVRQDTAWSTRECILCSSLFKPSAELRDIYMNLSEWTDHFYGEHAATEKLSSGKRLKLHPCHQCGVVFFSNTTLFNHNAAAHEGAGPDPEAEIRRGQTEEGRKPMGQAAVQISSMSLTAKEQLGVIIDSLKKSSVVSLSTPANTKDKALARRGQSKMSAARTGSKQRKTNVVYKCSKCGGMFPDDASFERHAREKHRGVGNDDEGNVPSRRRVSSDPPSAMEVKRWDVLVQRECSDCSKLMELCPRSSEPFVRRDVWERHVNEVHLTGRWRCTGKQIRLHPCPRCPRLLLSPAAVQAHQTKLHDTMLGSVAQADVDGSTLTNTLECSCCAQLVQNADGIRFLDYEDWNKHFMTEHKELLLWDGEAGNWQLFPCPKCQRLFFSEQDILIHEARQAFMHMALPANVKVTTKQRGPRVEQQTEILYQCANDDCSFTSQEHDLMVQHFQQCRESRPMGIGETVLYKTVMVSKPKPKRFKTPNQYPLTRRLENVMQKLAPDNSTGDAGGRTLGEGATDDEPSEAAEAVSQLLEAEPGAPAVLELDPATGKPFTAHILEAAEDVPEAAAEEETVAAEESQTDNSATAEDAADGQPTRMDFACSVCQMRGSTRDEIALHIRREHKRKDGTFDPPYRKEKDKRQETVQKYKKTYLCDECKHITERCPRTEDLFFKKALWIKHLNTTHKPSNFSPLDRLDLHECEECEKLFLSHAALKRHLRFYHEPGAENYPVKPKKDRAGRPRFRCTEEGCTFKYHKVTRLRIHLIDVHKFDLTDREVSFSGEDEFQEWKKTLELNTCAYFVLRSNVQAKRKNGTFNARYFGCSRVMWGTPTIKRKGKKLTLPWREDLLKEDMVWRCPAFIKAEVPVDSTKVLVRFCPNHYGHDMDPSFGRLTDADEAEIGGMLQAGISTHDVVRRIREESRHSSIPTRKQRVTETEINRIYEKYMGMKPPKTRLTEPLVAKEVTRTGQPPGSPKITWNADFVTSYEDGTMQAQDAVVEELSMEDTEAVDESLSAHDTWQRVCGEEDCHFTTTSVGFLRSHLRQRHGFAMHIDTAGFASMKDFNRWKRSLEKRTCAKYICYKSVVPADLSDPVVTRYYTCHRSGLNALKKTPNATAPSKLVLCTGYMKVRCNLNTGEATCEYCASHYGHDARLSHRYAAQHEPSSDLMPVEFETVEDDGQASPPMIGHFGSPERYQFSSPSAPRYSFIREDVTATDQVEQERPRRPRGRPPKKRRSAPRRGRGGKRRRWEEIEEEEEEEEEEQQEEDSYESDE